jgi:UDP-galactopyranose mutase
MERTLAEWRVPIAAPRNSEEVIISQVGRPLYERFFENYTRKQWRREPRDLDPSVCGRIPIRTNRDAPIPDRTLPGAARARIYRNVRAHARAPKIEVRLKTDFHEARTRFEYRHLIYTGPIDAYFDHRLGPLPYRSLRFEPETFTDREFYQPAMQVNYPNDHDFTRIVEIKHATGQKIDATTIVREYPEDFRAGKGALLPDSGTRYSRIVRALCRPR